MPFPFEVLPEGAHGLREGLSYSIVNVIQLLGLSYVPENDNPLPPGALCRARF